MRAGAAASLALLVAGAAAAQTVYKYRDANGVWMFSDRPPPAGQAYEEQALARRFEPPEVRLVERPVDTGAVLLAVNGYYAPVQLAYELTVADNVAADTPRKGIATLPPRSETELATIRRRDARAAMNVTTEFRYLPGSPEAVHAPDGPYRLPYPLARAFRVTQAYPDGTTHRDLGSQHAIDFAMPVGTPVHAARAGVVIEVASNHFESGTNLAEDGPRANIVRVLHDDGTMAVYAHLALSSVRVVPGQRVARGEYVADSGNTGFSTGPHLHFVVQRNRDGQLVSVPVEFAGAGGASVTLVRGAEVVAY